MEITRDDLAAMAAGNGNPPANNEGGDPTDENAQAVDKQSAPEPQEYVYPDTDDVPEPLRGKKANEVVGLYKALQTGAQTMAQTINTLRSTPAPAAAPPAPVNNEPIFGKDDFIDPHASNVEDKIKSLFARTAAPLMIDVYRQNTATSIQLAEQSLPHFKRFKQEIFAEVGNTPISQTANLDYWRDTYDKVVGRHADELGREAANQSRIKETPPSERGTGRSGGGDVIQRNAATEMTAEDKQMADALGVSHTDWAKFKPFFSSED